MSDGVAVPSVDASAAGYDFEKRLPTDTEAIISPDV
jgi:hypothetical protein